MKKKVIVGLSGGVDSSVAAALLIKNGYEVIGVTMKIHDKNYSGFHYKNACFGADEESEIKTAEKICEVLNIPFHIIDLSELYKNEILNYFKEEYYNGRTPNPCMLCNKKIKFKALLENVVKSGIEFDYFATGHYADVKFDNISKRYLLYKGKDIKKDQSYFLALLSQTQLSKLIFPLSELSKNEVRTIARNLNLPSYNKPESQDFYSGDYTELLDKSASGKIMTEDGKILGEHNGIIHYTIGQRHGLKIGYKEPLYVSKIDKIKNIVYVGSKNSILKTELTAANLNWIAFENFDKEQDTNARIRYLHKEAKARIFPINSEKIKVKFYEPQMAITPGQFVVFYDDDKVIGGGVIENVI